MKGKYRMYNIASGQNISLGQISKKIKKITNCKILYKKNLMTFKEPKINITRIKKEFNFRPKYNLIDFIEEVVKNQKNSY